MHAFLSADESESFLLEELRQSFPHGRNSVIAPALVQSDLVLQPEAPPTLAFTRQLLLDAQEHRESSIANWSERLAAKVIPGVPEGQPWHLHVAPHYGFGRAGQHRCQLIRESFLELLRRKRRHILRLLQDEPGPLTPAHSVVQLLLTAPERGLLSVAPAPLPFQFRRLISPFPKGHIPPARDEAAPCRAFAKLVEAELRLGRRIAAGETCVDLGASPGSWTYVALRRGARVIAIDRAPLRSDLMRHTRLEFRKGDAFAYRPEVPVDWLLCDVIAAPGRSIGLVLDWVRHRLARQFVVTIKFKGRDEYGALEPLKHALPPQCDEFFLTRLCANQNEACTFGAVRPEGRNPEPESGT